MYRYKQNLHTHSIYCDGKNTPEEMVKRAIELGFDTIGFSGHSNTKFDIDWHLTPEKNLLYIEEVNRLKEKYKSDITVLLGIEYEMLSGREAKGYDYMIGSSHFINTAEGEVSFDEPADVVKDIIDKYFDGQGIKLAKAYYSQLAHLFDYGDFDIVGHFDIVSKHTEKHGFFDTDSKEYKNYALEALHALSDKKRVFEVNTGVIPRGYKSIPYPAPFILKEMKRLGHIVIITSDCHKKEYLNSNFDTGIELIKSCGYTSVGVMKDGKIQEEKI
ncbi:MAG: histidinol-phosphatase HisJ family protein [Ruminococcaceae bacterium]|nr:histidinol-phosphatase HisJ family protein [Oscillospiraceae bacterium]